MKISISAIGRLRKSPEKELIELLLMKGVYLYHPKSSQTIFQTGSLMVLGIAI